jgi:hypothetical protein
MFLSGQNVRQQIWLVFNPQTAVFYIRSTDRSFKSKPVRGSCR